VSKVSWFYKKLNFINFIFFFIINNLKIKYYHIIFIILNTFIVDSVLFSQSVISSDFKKVNVKIESKLLLNDSLTIVPSSVSIMLKDSTYLKFGEFVIDNTKILLRTNTFQNNKNNSCLIKYNTLNVNIGKYYYHLDSTAMKESEKAIYIGYDLSKRRDDNTEIMPSSLDYDGSFSRGFSVGNKQSLVLNSNLNLQMSGDIGGGLKLKAAISDANIPIQPEGSTQRLNEFDKVFIEISKDKHSLVAGDFELKNPEGYFLKYNKKLKGLKYSNVVDLKNNKSIKSSVSFAISKGKFSRNTLKINNGNQGPYKLKGANGERYLIVLSGTEKVFLDGKLLKRGRDFDYVIDYNIAEITFIKTMITENSRVIVEFEYSDQNYLRSLQAINSSFGDKDNNVYLSFYNEQDSKTAQGLIDLDSLDKEFLAKTGDSFEDSFKSGIRYIGDSLKLEDRIYYKFVFESSINDSILVYTTLDSAKYIAIFSDFGENNGSYEIDKTNTLNGRVYKWVGKNKGNFEPKIQLIPPEKKQMISLGTNLKLGENTIVNAEISISNIDKNRFSEKDSKDDVGFAGLIKLNSVKKIKLKTKDIIINNKGKYEFSGSDFNPLNPYRSTEFSRDWNFSNNTSHTAEHLIENDFSVQISNLLLSYNYSGFFKTNSFVGNKHIPKIEYNNGGFSLSAKGSLLQSSDDIYKTVFFRPNINISQKIGFLNDIKIGFYYEKEKNVIKSISNDSLTNQSFNYDYYKVYLGTKSSNRANVKMYVSYRKDFLPINNSYLDYTGATQIGVEGNWNVKNKSKLKYNISYRQLNIINNLSNFKKPESNILGKLQHTLNVLKGSVYSNTNIEFGSGQQAKVEYEYVYVASGVEGGYVWIDSDPKDSLKQKHEFRKVPGIDTANYRRYTNFNNEFERVNSTLFNNTIKISGAKLFRRDSNKVIRFLSKLSYYSIFKMLQKTESDENGTGFPVVTSLQDSSLVSYNYNYTSTLFFNRGNPTYDLNIGYKNIARQINQVGGFVKNNIKEYFGAIRYNYKSNLDLISKVTFGNKSYEVDNSISGDFLFKYFSFGQEANIFFNRKFGLKLNYNYSDKKNQWGEMEKAKSHDFKMTAKILKFKKMKINTSFSYVKIDYSGGINQLIELSMLDGLKDGNNYIWSIKFNKRLKNNFDIIFQYNGRKSQDSNVIHQGKMQARASF